MMTARQISANGANARKSAGPRSKTGKAASRLNAYRHGLAGALELKLGEDEEIERLLRAIAGPEARPEVLALARRVAEAEMTVRRVFRARMILAYLAQQKVELKPPNPPAESVAPDLSLHALERYERRALSRRKSAIKDFDLVRRSARRSPLDRRSRTHST